MVENLLAPQRRSRPFLSAAIVFVLGLAVGAAVVYVWLNWGQSALAISTRAPDTAPLAEGSLHADVSLAEPIGAPSGPLAVTHTPGELVRYRIDATVTGGGRELGEALDITMQFGGDYNLYTSAVDADGAAELRVVFENAGLTGNFLGEPYEFQFAGPSGPTDPSSAGAPSIGTPSDEAATLAFLTKPITIKVGPSGQVLKVDGPEGFAELIAYTPALAQVEYPDGEWALGRQWTSHLRLPLPGIADLVDSRVVNTFMGNGVLGGRTCGVIQQEIVSRQEGGTAQVPDQNGMMELSIPMFDVTGRNTIYFDVVTGKLVHAVLDLEFHLRIREALGDYGKIIESLGRQVFEGRFKGLEDVMPAPEKSKQDLLDLSVSIDGAITQLGAPAAPQ